MSDKIWWDTSHDYTNWSGFNPAAGEDHSAASVIRGDGWSFVCDIPRNIGNLLELKMRSGKFTLETDSGITMIIPISSDRSR